MKGVQFNINDDVSVKLTDVGRKELERQHDELKKWNPGINLPESSPPKEDNEGWSRWQLWDLMNRFGHMLSNGCDEPFEMNIRIGV